MTSSQPAPAERVECPPRQAGVIETDYGRCLVAVELIGIALDGQYRCVGCGGGTLPAAHGRLCRIRVRVPLTPYRLARVAAILGASIAAIESRIGRLQEVAHLLAVQCCLGRSGRGTLRWRGCLRLPPKAALVAPADHPLHTRHHSSCWGHYLSMNMLCFRCPPVASGMRPFRPRIQVGCRSNVETEALQALYDRYSSYNYPWHAWLRRWGSWEPPARSAVSLLVHYC